MADNKLVVGAIVIVRATVMFGPLKPVGFCGAVVALNVKAGFCVRLHISRIYRPCFWFSYEGLVMSDEQGPPDMSWSASFDSIESALGGRVIYMVDSPIVSGCLRSWLLDKSGCEDGDKAIESKVQTIKFDNLLQMYSDTSDFYFDEWMKKNTAGMSVRRTRLMKIKPGNPDGAIELKRPWAIKK